MFSTVELMFSTAEHTFNDAEHNFLFIVYAFSSYGESLYYCSYAFSVLMPNASS